jgi:hypothetical protein
MATSTTSSQPSQALLFIPDISGFTQFVNDTEINHARHIIEELLNLIIESNQIGLEVSEIEGDAILFYKMGPPPSAKALLNQVKKMFTEFHFHLQKYDAHRICNCAACKSADSLTLKFVVHYGEVAINKVHNHEKLFGIDVITVHRLLKNNVNNREYALLTNRVTEVLADWNEKQEGWNEVARDSETYDSGRVDYSYLTLENLYRDIPELQPDDFRMKGHTTSLLKTDSIIEAPLELVFDVAIDVKWRPQWIPGTLPETTDINTYIAQNGQTHRCIANGPVMVVHDFKMEKNRIYFSETDRAKNMGCVYTLTRLEGNRSHLDCEFFMPGNFFKAAIFKLLMKKKLKAVCLQSWINLDAYCKELLIKQETHPYSIILSGREMEIHPN